MDKQLALTSLSERNYGIVTMVELTALGFSPDQVKRLVRSGRLERRHHRVFRFRGSAITWEQELVAACRWAGERAAATHLSAARLWELDGFRDLSIQITTPERRRAKPGVTLHQRTLRPDEVEIRRGIPVTSVPRTLLDLGSSALAGGHAQAESPNR